MSFSCPCSEPSSLIVHLCQQAIRVWEGKKSPWGMDQNLVCCLECHAIIRMHIAIVWLRSSTVSGLHNPLALSIQEKVACILCDMWFTLNLLKENTLYNLDINNLWHRIWRANASGGCWGKIRQMVAPPVTVSYKSENLYMTFVTNL
jgi:hypothetical protein